MMSARGIERKREVEGKDNRDQPAGGERLKRKSDVDLLESGRVSGLSKVTGLARGCVVGLGDAASFGRKTPLLFEEPCPYPTCPSGFAHSPGWKESHRASA